MHGTKISVFSPLTKEACHTYMACMKTIWKCKQSWNVDVDQQKHENW